MLLHFHKNRIEIQQITPVFRKKVFDLNNIFFFMKYSCSRAFFPFHFVIFLSTSFRHLSTTSNDFYPSASFFHTYNSPLCICATTRFSSNGQPKYNSFVQCPLKSKFKFIQHQSVKWTTVKTVICIVSTKYLVPKPGSARPGIQPFFFHLNSCQPRVPRISTTRVARDPLREHFKSSNIGSILRPTRSKYIYII